LLLDLSVRVALGAIVLAKTSEVLVKNLNRWAVLPFSIIVGACGGVDPGSAAGADPSEAVASTEEGIDGFSQYAVGVYMPDARYCWADMLVTIYTDDEDDNNESDSTAFESTDTVRRARRHDTGRTGTTWKFCKFDGRPFKSLTRYGNTDYYYATLKLGTTCPNGSMEFRRNITNEVESNANFITGPAGPNSVSNTGTELFFCMFGTNTDKMYSFPDFGMPYAVFHDYDSGQPSLFFAKKWVYSDDEDFHNFNGTTPGSGPDFALFDNMVGGGANTMYDLAQVR
jgi:hypothetical protein